MNATEGLVDFIVDTPAEAVPPEAITAAKRAVLDTIGVALAGVPEPGPRIVRELVAEHGPGPASLLGMAQRAQIGDAAWANGTAAHALDYDDTTVPMHGHPSAPLLPAVLAVAEARGLSGAALLDAFVIGFEVESTVGSALGDSHYSRGWHATATTGTLGVAAASARLAGLGPEQTANALGIALSTVFRNVQFAVLGVLLSVLLSGVGLQFLGLNWMSTTAVIDDLPQTFRGETDSWEQVRVMVVFSALTVAAMASGMWYFRRKDL